MNKTLKTAFIAAAATMLAGCSALAPRTEQQEAKEPAAQTETKTETEAQIARKKELSEQLSVLANAMLWIRENAVEPISIPDLTRRALAGMTESIDPHSAYLDDEEMAEWWSSLQGSYGGIGIEFTVKDGVATLTGVTPDRPAAAAGLKAGDVIATVEGTDVKGKNANEIAQLLQGEADTDVKIGILSPGAASPLEYTLRRVEIVQQTVFQKELADGIAYVRISSFSRKTPEQLEAVLKSFEEKGSVKSYILDLRGNPGGSLPGAVKVADLFLDAGTIVSTRGQKSSPPDTATQGDAINGKPLAVLVDGRSASASEIVSGALKDNGRATLFGVRTFGKGLVQTLHKLSAFNENRKDGIKVTTQHYYTPSGISIQKNGVLPHVDIDDAVEAETQKRSEASLEGALDNPDANAPAQKAVPPTTTCRLTPETSVSKVDGDFLRASGKTVDTTLLCAFEYMKGQVTHTTRVPYAPKPAQTPAKPAA